MWKPDRIGSFGLLVSSLLLLTACNSMGEGTFSSFGNKVTELDLPTSVEPFPDDEVLKVAKVQFGEGNYGHAARYFERAVEVHPNDAEAWLGLAASYDRIRRFDLADRAYREAARYAGGRPEYYNNVGYSYLLRGDSVKARSNFLKAYDLDPASPTVNNNLEMLRDNITRRKQN
jgi:Flp pilus assembly protein TadD